MTKHWDTEEPCDGKLSSTVLESSGSREGVADFTAYRDEFIFTDCSIRNYFDQEELLNVDRDVNASINIKRVGLGLFPTIKCRRGKVVIIATATASTSKEVLEVLRNARSLHRPLAAV